MVRRRAPHAAIEIVPGAGHFVMLEQPDRVNAAIAGFIGRLAGR
jgi:pimeloyl-ACP methyl ester carboxylesterase